VSGQTWRPIFPPLALVRALAGLAESGVRALGRRPPITRHQVERTLRSARFDGARARGELGWTPRVSVEEALRRTFAARRSGVGEG
jgi:nucleoside-diphosphate-sugar epimerase